jgi:hypothetical protein
MFASRQLTPNLNTVQNHPIGSSHQFLNEAPDRCDSDVRANDQVGRPGDCGGARRGKKTNFHEWPQAKTSITVFLWLFRNRDHSNAPVSHDILKRGKKRMRVVLYSPHGLQRGR